MTDKDFLEAQVRGLEMENSRLKASLWDGYFVAVLPFFAEAAANKFKNDLDDCQRVRPVVFDSYVTSELRAAAIVADEALRVRNERYGQPEKKAEIETAVPAIVFYAAGSLGEEVAP